MKTLHAKQSRGDTIVEVLISIAIIGAVIAGAYALASRSLREGVSAAEHGEAIKLVQNQIELLKFRQRYTSPANWTSQFATSGGGNHNNFCIVSGPTQEDDSSFTNNWWPQENPDPSNLTLPGGGLPGGYNTACTDPGKKYFINISEHAVSPAGTYPTYLITVQWVPAGGGPPSRSQSYYRF